MIYLERSSLLPYQSQDKLKIKKIKGISAIVRIKLRKDCTLSHKLFFISILHSIYIEVTILLIP